MPGDHGGSQRARPPADKGALGSPPGIPATLPLCGAVPGVGAQGTPTMTPSRTPPRSGNPGRSPPMCSPLDTASIATDRSSSLGPEREKVYDPPVSYAGPQWPGSEPDTQLPGPETAGHSPRAKADPSPYRRRESLFFRTPPEKLDRGGDLCIVMVGLPGRGKTYYAHKLCRYVNWLGINTQCFLVSEYLRQHRYMDERGLAKFRVDYFDPQNSDAMMERMSALAEALHDIRAFLTDGGQVAILDGQATSLRVRARIHESVSSLMSNRRVIYLEVVMGNRRAEELYELKVQSALSSTSSPLPESSDGTPPGVMVSTAARRSDGSDAIGAASILGPECGEYAGLSLEEALDDFKKRVDIFEQDYVPLNVDVHGGGDKSRDAAYIRIIDGGEEERTRYEVTGVRGFLPSRLVNWIFNLSPSHRLRHPIYFARHGQSEYNLTDRIGGDPGLTERGREDARLIADWVVKLGHSTDQLEVWTSRLTRTIETAAPLQQRGYKTLKWRALNEIHAGICECLTYSDVKKRFPFIEHWRKEDKYTFRYPEGESYQDLVNRLEPVLMELECAEQPVLVIAHQAVLRCIFAYFEESAAEQATNITVPQATVWEYHPTGQGVGKLQYYSLRDQSDLTGLSEMTFCSPSAQAAAAAKTNAAAAAAAVAAGSPPTGYAGNSLLPSS
eukprot:TRINITY_DN4085_c0_g1_i1.p1 TRINITY_DN4085_c0_g1~~TRINITY_DN4085_c0_g1_i1.p1  ORF type:complete len:672 (+),score=200.17 TRINITY_DN4085_c0_g1_i1:102-2117(+)